MICEESYIVQGPDRHIKTREAGSVLNSVVFQESASEQIVHFRRDPPGPSHNSSPSERRYRLIMGIPMHIPICFMVYVIELII